MSDVLFIAGQVHKRVIIHTQDYDTFHKLYLGIVIIIILGGTTIFYFRNVISKWM